MNKARRKAIAEIVEKLEVLKSELESVAQEERDSFDTMPEGLQQGERGQASDEAAYSLEDAAGEIDNVLANLSEVADIPR